MRSIYAAFLNKCSVFLAVISNLHRTDPSDRLRVLAMHLEKQRRY